MNELAHQTKGSAQERGTEGGRGSLLVSQKNHLCKRLIYQLSLCLCVWEREKRVWMLLSKTIKLHVTPRREKRLNLSISRRRMENGV